jgi:hypothetical protein
MNCLASIRGPGAPGLTLFECSLTLTVPERDTVAAFQQELWSILLDRIASFSMSMRTSSVDVYVGRLQRNMSRGAGLSQGSSSGSERSEKFQLARGSGRSELRYVACRSWRPAHSHYHTYLKAPQYHFSFANGSLSTAARHLL